MPKTSLAKGSRIDLRVTQDQKELLEKAASLKGISGVGGLRYDKGGAAKIKPN
jgi:Protein of unknown function (DUF1778)